jgi:exodeoxyribonuclease V alpha subunit
MIINSIIYEKESKYGYRIGLKCEDNIVMFGYHKYIPFENDSIECNDLIHKKDNQYEFKNAKILLPIETFHQKNRIRRLLFKNGLNENLLENFDIFPYGSNKFWYEICNYYYKNNSIEDYQMENYIKIAFNHISNYINIIIQPFKDKLISLNNKLKYLKQHQCLILIQHKLFGLDIENWLPENLIELFNENNFGLQTIINIANALNANINDLTKIIIYYKLNYKDNSTIIEYDYNIWNNDLYELLEENKIINLNLFNNNLTEKNFNNIITEMIESKKIIKIKNYLAGAYIYDKELKIADLLIDIKNSNLNLLQNKNIEYVKEFLNNYQTETAHSLDEDQKTSILNVINYPISITFGRAGTGKSSVIESLIKTIESKDLNFTNKTTNIKFYFLAPTAKAKYRMETIITRIGNDIKDDTKDYMFKTIHSFVRIVQCSQNSIIDGEFNVFIIDEMSMLDLHIFYEFLLVIKNKNVILMFLGDDRQLPSINKGNILYDILNSKILPYCELKTTYRYNSLEYLKNLLNNYILKYKKIPINFLSNTSEFKFIDSKEINLKKTLKKECKQNDIIITPMNKEIDNYTDIIRSKKNLTNIIDINLNNNIKILNEVELLKLNEEYEIEEELDISKTIINNNNILKFYCEIEFDESIKYKINDPVIHTKNNSSENLFNGLSGIIKIIFEWNNNKYIIIQRDDNKNYYCYDTTKDDFKYLKPSYIITIHKSQGSEWNNVLVILNTKNRMLNNKLLYTAITRAQKSITIISNIDIINHAIKLNENRNTLLSNMLQFYNEPLNYNNFIEYYENLN